MSVKSTDCEAGDHMECDGTVLEPLGSGWRDPCGCKCHPIAAISATPA